MNELNSVQPDFEMANEWMEQLCRTNGVKSCEDLTLDELEEELEDTSREYAEEKERGIPDNEQFIATLLSYMDWLNDLILDQAEG